MRAAPKETAFAPAAPVTLVALAPDGLRDLVRAAVEEALATREPRPALLDQNALARELGVSTRTVYALRQDGLPIVWVGDSPRFELAPCLAWLRERRQVAA